MSSYEQKIAIEDKLSRRNAMSAQQGLRHLDERISDLHKIITNQQQGIAAMGQRINDLENRLLAQKVAMTGSGPTVGVSDGDHD